MKPVREKGMGILSLSLVPMKAAVRSGMGFFVLLDFP